MPSPVQQSQTGMLRHDVQEQLVLRRWLLRRIEVDLQSSLRLVLFGQAATPARSAVTLGTSIASAAVAAAALSTAVVATPFTAGPTTPAVATSALATAALAPTPVAAATHAATTRTAAALAATLAAAHATP